MDALENGRKDLERGKPCGVKEADFSEEDIGLLKLALEKLEEALGDERWLALQGGRCGVSLPFPLKGVPELLEEGGGGSVGFEVGGSRYYLPSEVEKLRIGLGKREERPEVVLETSQSTKLNFILSEVGRSFF